MDLRRDLRRCPRVPVHSVNYLTELGQAIRREIDPKVVPEGNTDSLFRLYAVLALTKSTAVTAEDVHNAWAAWMSDQDPTHEAIQPYNALRSNVRREDQPFVEAIRAVASRLP